MKYDKKISNKYEIPINNQIICHLKTRNPLNDNEFVSSYPGSFFSCKELLQCQNCELIFADKLPSKKELDEYYEMMNEFRKQYIDFKEAEKFLSVEPMSYIDYCHFNGYNTEFKEDELKDLF